MESSPKEARHHFRRDFSFHEKPWAPRIQNLVSSDLLLNVEQGGFGFPLTQIPFFGALWPWGNSLTLLWLFPYLLPGDPIIELDEMIWWSHTVGTQETAVTPTGSEGWCMWWCGVNLVMGTFGEVAWRSQGLRQSWLLPLSLPQLVQGTGRQRLKGGCHVIALQSNLSSW